MAIIYRLADRIVEGGLVGIIVIIFLSEFLEELIDIYIGGI